MMSNPSGGGPGQPLGTIKVGPAPAAAATDNPEAPIGSIRIEQVGPDNAQNPVENEQQPPEQAIGSIRIGPAPEPAPEPEPPPAPAEPEEEEEEGIACEKDAHNRSGQNKEHRIIQLLTLGNIAHTRNACHQQ